MAKRGSQIPPSTQGNDNPDAPAYSPFLKAKDLGETGHAQFLLSGWAREIDGQFGKQIIVEVVHQATGAVFDFAIKRGSPNHRELHTRMGPDPLRWKGTIDLSSKHGDFGDYIVIDKVPF
jgi:hypothetical protein